MPQYRKKPIEITAYIWDGTPDLIVTAWGEATGITGKPGRCMQCDEPLLEHGSIKTLEGHHIACKGDFIITGIQGEHYPCKPDIFNESYDLVTQEDNGHVEDGFGDRDARD